MNHPPVADRLADFIGETTTEFFARYAPDGRLPGHLGGFILGDDARIDCLRTLADLPALGLPEIAGQPVEALIAAELPRLDGRAIQTFYCYRLAEVLLGYGGFTDANPLLAGLDAAQRANLALGCDPTDMFDPATGELRGHPNNYWAVLARGEWLRHRLGLETDPSILNRALERTRALLAANPRGFFDDDRDGRGRYDVYSADVVLFSETLADPLGPELWRRLLAVHVDLLARIVQPSGVSFAWGRSIGPFSHVMTIELAAAALAHGLGDPAHALAWIEAGLTAVRRDFSDGLVSAHVGRAQDSYRGPQRRVQATFDLLGKLAYAARHLRGVDTDAEPAPAAEAFAPCDDWIAFDERGHGVWSRRSRQGSFQLPVVQVRNADYAAWPHWPRRFEVPADSTLFAGTPRVRAGGHDYVAAGPLLHSEKQPMALAVTLGDFAPLGAASSEAPVLSARRQVFFRVDGPWLEVSEKCTFASPPDAFSIAVPEAARRLALEISSPLPHRVTHVPVEDIADYRGFWTPLRTWHEIHVQPARDIALTYRVRPVPRVATVPGDHDYVRALYDAMPAGAFDEVPLVQHRPPDDTALLAAVRAADVLHLGWPEHLFAGAASADEAGRARYRRFLSAVADSGVRVLWTLHNRRPHAVGETPWTNELWESWARLAHGVIHHSQWGAERMTAELPFRRDAVHRVIPHGHYGDAMRDLPPRAEIERSLGLTPCAVRLGVVGRPRREKQVEMIARAFVRGAPADWQLLIGAADKYTELPADPRVIALRRDGWLPRAAIARQIAVCDALVAAVAGPHYLTSGQPADALGAGLPMICIDWPFLRETLGRAALVYGTTEDDLAAFLATLDRDRLATAASAAREIAPLFAWPRLARQTLDLLETLGPSIP
jgi:glycosyltransferase involved in cell wall biosynthesis